MDLETNAYNALKVLHEHSKLTYNQWRLKAGINVETMNNVRRLLLDEKLINEERIGKQVLQYSINILSDKLINNIENLTASFSDPIKLLKFLTTHMQEREKTHERILNQTESDKKIARDFWKSYKNLTDIIINCLDVNKIIDLAIRHPNTKTPAKALLKQKQKEFFDSLETFFKIMYETEPILCMELFQILYFQKDSKIQN